ncbi:hypothetical protein ILUMI_03366 [Ignelater luminosus]|uniref:PiggyBac transposable element-derived protein domain-containing protein n=1 Tax=Ignelater luminosus TaxID=2038154 RepID=A0A8K0GM86_IGNLU|nr:hypothetical protein ILUMI_03366 [Ignelater luminosus]
MDTRKYWRQPLSTADLLELLEENENVVPDCIYITPPDNQGWKSDEDSGDEDCNDPNRLNLDRDLQKNPKSQTNVKRLPPIILSKDSKPLEFLELFLSSDVLETLVKNTVMYAASKNYKLEVGNEKMLVFISILYISGYDPVPRRRMFWEGRSDTKNDLVSNSMRRNRFEDIFRYIHATGNNNLHKNDKMAKLRPLIEKVNELFVRYTPVSKDMSIDESMIPYFGRNGCKQFIRGKPIRFGYKAWVLAQPSGYCVNFDIYQGRTANRDNSIGLGESAVMKFADLLKNIETDGENKTLGAEEEIHEVEELKVAENDFPEIGIGKNSSNIFFKTDRERQQACKEAVMSMLNVGRKNYALFDQKPNMWWWVGFQTQRTLPNGKGYFYVWTENQGDRGSEEIGSSILACLENIKEQGSAAHHTIPWSDSAEKVKWIHVEEFGLTKYRYSFDEAEE